MTKIPELTALYLEALAACAQEAGYEPVLQRIQDQVGRLWLTAAGTTRSYGVLHFKFELDHVVLAYEAKHGGEKVGLNVAYAEGLDAFLRLLSKTLKANRIAYGTAYVEPRVKEVVL